MDKAEYQVKLDQLKALVADQDYDGALDIVKGIDWRRVKNIRTLCMVADVYEANDMLEDCRRILLLALKRASIGKSILSRLVELSLMMNDTAGASEYYRDFIKAAPRDAARYLLQYKILKANQSSVEEQIEALHDYKESEYTERWAYELARLYDKAGRVEECVEECDDIILWFSEGVYVVKAMELKMKHTPLTPSQQDKYDHRFETMPELLEKEEPKFPKKKKKPEVSAVQEAPVVDTAMTDAAEGTVENIVEDTVQDAAQDTVPEEPQRDIFTSTIDLQSRLSQGIKRVISSMIREEDDTPEEEEKAAEEEIFANVEEDRYAPQLEPEQMAESGVRRDQVMTKPEAMKEEEVGGDTFDFSAMFEAQADAFAADEEPVQETPQPTVADIPAETELTEEPADDFDLSKVLESEVADILNEKKKETFVEEVVETVVEESETDPQMEKSEPEEAEAEPQIEEAAAEEPEEESQIEETAAEEPEEESQIENLRMEDLQVEKPDISIDFEQQIIEAVEAEIAAGKEKQSETAAVQEPVFDLEEQILKAMSGEEEEESEEIPAKTVDLQEQMAAEKEAEEKTAAEETGEPADEEFDLQSLLAAEVTDMISNPAEPEASEEEETPQEVEEDIVSRLEKEADRTIVHSELEKETPQDKRLRIMRAAPANRMTDEQKRVFTYFAKVPGMDTQILEAMNQAYNGAVSKTSRHGNIAIMGRKGTGKTRLSEGLIKALCREFEMSAAKFARIHARDLNKKDVAQVVSKLAGGFLVIEKASLMSEATIMKLNQAMEFRTDSMILIIEDEKDAMRSMLDDNPEFAEKFDAVIKIPVFTNDELVTFARTYAGECGYKMDEMGILALYTIIGANQSVDEPVSIAKVKEMVDAAIAKASKGGRKIGRKLSGRQVDRMNRIILYEKDFEL